jgi:hypothetical protein
VNVSFVTPRLARLSEHAGARLCLFAFEERHPLAGITGALDWRLHGHLSQLVIRGFLTGAAGEALLVPLGDRLPLPYLIVVGLGTRAALTAGGSAAALRRMFDAADRLAGTALVVALPGRPEQIADPAEAISCFLEAYDARGGGRKVVVADTAAAQKAMLPVLERFRLKRSVPA